MTSSLGGFGHLSFFSLYPLGSCGNRIPPFFPLQDSAEVFRNAGICTRSPLPSFAPSFLSPAKLWAYTPPAPPGIPVPQPYPPPTSTLTLFSPPQDGSFSLPTCHDSNFSFLPGFSSCAEKPPFPHASRSACVSFLFSLQLITSHSGSRWGGTNLSCPLPLLGFEVVTNCRSPSPHKWGLRFCPSDEVPQHQSLPCFPLHPLSPPFGLRTISD